MIARVSEGKLRGRISTATRRPRNIVARIFAVILILPLVITIVARLTLLKAAMPYFDIWIDPTLSICKKVTSESLDSSELQEIIKHDLQ
jgi:hypothetical protein